MRRVPLVAAFAMMCAAACSSSSSDGGAGSGGGGGGGSGGDLGGLGASCTAPLAPADVSQPTTVVGNGTAASCTAGALAAAIAKAGVITFDCGGAATITLTEQLVLSTTSDTIIDGGGHITIDGGGATRLFYYSSGNYRATHTTVTLQHLTLQNGKASGTMIPTAPPPCSQGFQIDGSGAAIFVRDGILHVLDVTFTNDAAASPGPDVGGGAIYANGSLGVVVADSRFVGNSGSNGGAIGSLNSDLVLVGNTFDGNHATGSGANGINNACTVNGGESGDGGNGGAVVIDGGSDGTVTTCGNLFHANVAGALGGALFRTPDGPVQTTTIDQSLFDGNSADGGGALYLHHSRLTITASTFSANSATGAGAVQADDTVLDFTNVTFAGNRAIHGLGGAMSIFGNGGTLTNVTFANNLSDGGSGFFAAAIAGGTSFTIVNSLFMNDTTNDAGAPMQCQGASTGTGDLQWPMTHTTGGAADAPCVGGITFADAMLQPLADNGGATPTLAIAASSPAAGIGTACPATDQRGHARDPSHCAAGAFEP